MRPRRYAVMMRSEVLRLSASRRAQGEVLNAVIWGQAITAVLDREPRGKYRLGGHVRIWPGFDAETIADAMRQLGFKIYDIDKMFDAAARRKRKITSIELGRLLGLTAAERAELNIRCIDACDQTVFERRDAAKRRKIDRDRRRSKTSRADYEEKSLMKMKPWEAEGICRRTWYLRRKTASGAEIPDTCANLSQLKLDSIPDTAQTCATRAKQLKKAATPKMHRSASHQSL